MSFKVDMDKLLAEVDPKIQNAVNETLETLQAGTDMPDEERWSEFREEITKLVLFTHFRTYNNEAKNTKETGTLDGHVKTTRP